MQSRPSAVRHWTAAILFMIPVLFGGCGSKESPPATTTTPAATGGDEAVPAVSDVAVDLAPETLEALVAPIALYPDVVLGHVLLASTNPQEVLDAGNWLLEHADLSPAKLNTEAEKLGMSTSMRALLPFPETVDMMCREIEWTTDLGAAFTADQAAVLDAVQRLRTQATAVGNLQTTEQLKVETVTTEGKQAITIEPPKPDVIYVPQYDPVAVYAPPPATIPAPTQTVVVQEKSSSGSAIVTGLLCFTAGVLIADALHDDYYGYAPHYGYGGMYYGGHPYYPPPPYMYRPPYGGGYYPAHGYYPPPSYNHNFNNNTIIINKNENNYWNNDFGGGGRGDGRSASRKLESPITKAKPNRPELNQLNAQGQERTRKAVESKKPGGRDMASAAPAAAGARDKAAQAKAPTAKPAVKGSYAGTEKARAQNVAGAKAATGDRATAAAGTKTAAGAKTAAAARPTPAASKGTVDRGYAGKTAGAAKPAAGAAAAARPEVKKPTATAARPEVQKPAARPEVQKPAARPDVSRPTPSATRPAATTASAPKRPSGGGGGGGGGGSAFSGASNGGAERAASQRGKASMPQGASRTSAAGAATTRRGR
jgi:hypothetical protein